MAAFSDSFGRPPAAGADASYCSHLPCVVRTRDAHVAEIVPRGVDLENSCFGSNFLGARRAVEDIC